MKAFAITACLLLLAGVATADNCVKFDFEDLYYGQGDSAISAYMTGEAGFDVETDGAKVGWDLGWYGNWGDYLYSSERGGAFSICFEQGITSIDFDGYVFDAQDGASVTDFRMFAYDYDGNLVGYEAYDTGGEWKKYWHWGWKWYFDEDDHEAVGPDGAIEFCKDVYKVVFSDDGKHDIGVDNICVTPVPLPAAAWLGFVMLGGLAAVRRIRRRK